MADPAAAKPNYPLSERKPYAPHREPVKDGPVEPLRKLMKEIVALDRVMQFELHQPLSFILIHTVASARWGKASYNFGNR